MSSNDVVWVMCFENVYHVFYSTCIDNDPKEPNYKSKYYKKFIDRKDALTYAHNVVYKIDGEYLEEGYPGVEYGVMEIGVDRDEEKKWIDYESYVCNNTKFKKLGKNVKIFDLAKIIKPEVIEIGDDSEIDDFTFVFGGKGIVIGKGVHVSRFVSIIGGGNLILGDYAVLADGVRILTGTDTYYGGSRMSTCAPEHQRCVLIGTVEIKKDAFIGTNSIVHPDVVIGEGAIIGSNSLVLKDVEPWSINVGSPCKKIKDRTRMEWK